MLRARQFLTRLISKCASRHNGMRSFDISTSKSGPTLVCFAHSDFQMCFAPQWGAIFSTSQPPKAVRRWCTLHILTSKCAWRHDVVQFFIFHLARWLRTRRFSEPFWPSGATNHWKNAVFRDFSTFWCTCIFFPLTLSLLWSSLFFSSLLFSSLPWLCPSAFDLSILSEVRLLNFLRLRLFEVVELCKLQKFGLE